MVLHARRIVTGRVKDSINMYGKALRCTFMSKICVVIPHHSALPSPPRTPSSTVQQYRQYSVTLTVQWQPPQYDGGTPVNYTITVSPGLSPVTTSGTSVPVTVSYNVIHTVSIVATNCNGSSSTVIVTIPPIGKLCEVIVSVKCIDVYVSRMAKDMQCHSCQCSQLRPHDVILFTRIIGNDGCPVVVAQWQSTGCTSQVSWVRFPAAAGLFTFLYFRLITSKLLFNCLIIVRLFSVSITLY